jgi:GntR family transcriptional regulator
MQIWLARGSEVSVREQLVTQVILGILGGDLAPGQRLPSTRELARRFHLHPNTVSSGYRQLARERWVEHRRGSGVFVCANQPEMPHTPALALDHIIATLLRSARQAGVPLPALRVRLRQWLELQPPGQFLLIEPNEELRRIVMAEMAESVSLPVLGCGLEADWKALPGSIPVALSNRLAAVRQALQNGTEVLTLRFRSVPSSLVKWLPAPAGALVGVASRWPDFLKMARTMLSAAGFDPESLVLRDVRQANWQRGLKQTTAVVCDTLTAKQLPAGCRAIPFPLLAESSIEELRRYEEFVSQNS